MRPPIRESVFALSPWLLVAVLSFPLSIYAQIYPDEPPRLRSENPIPAEFLRLSSEGYEADKARISSRGKQQKVEDQFYLESNFVIDQLLHSGQVLFNDPCSKYVAAIADEILESDPQLRKKLRFYTLKSSYPNAFATDRGSIFVSLGLLAQMESEAQLAYILAHEIIHVEEKHTLEFALQVSKIENQDFENTHEQLMAQSRYSKDQELEADAKGLELLMKSDYAPDAALQSLEALGSQLPFLGTEQLDAYRYAPWPIQIDTSISFLDMVESDSNEPSVEDEDLNLSTHPDLDTRLEKIKELLAATDKAGEFYVAASQEEFLEIQTLARYELCLQLLREGRFEWAIYAAEQLEENGQYLKWLEKIKTRAFYGMAMHYKEGYRESVLEADISDPYMIAFHSWLDTISSDKLAILSLERAWKATKEFPEDREYEIVAQELMYFLSPRLDRMFDFPELPAADDSAAQEDYDFLWDAMPVLRSFAEDSQFVMRHQEMLGYYNSDDGEDDRDYIKTLRRGESLGIDRILVLNPDFLRVDFRKRNPIAYEKGEKSKIRYQEIIEKCAKRLDLGIEMLVPQNFSSDDAKLFNDYSTLQEFIGNLGSMETWILPIDFIVINRIAEEYQTTNMVLPVGYSLIDHQSGKGQILLYGVALWFYFPVFAYMAATPQYANAHYMVIFDLEQGSFHASLENTGVYKDTKGTLNSNIYYQLMQIKRK